MAKSAGAFDSGPACSNGLCQFSTISLLASVSGALTVTGSLSDVRRHTTFSPSPVFFTTKKLAIRCGERPSHTEPWDGLTRLGTEPVGIVGIEEKRALPHEAATPKPHHGKENGLQARALADAHGLHAAHHRPGGMALHARLADRHLLFGRQADVAGYALVDAHLLPTTDDDLLAVGCIQHGFLVIVREHEGIDVGAGTVFTVV